MAKRVAELERENQHLAGKLKQAETIIEVKKNLGDLWDNAGRKERKEIMNTLADLSRHINKKAACDAFSVPRATFYRQTATVESPKVTGRL